MFLVIQHSQLRPLNHNRFTDFCSKFIRRPFYPPVVWRTGGQFSVKVAALKRNGTQSLSVTEAKAFHFAFPGTFTDLLI
jgi:hypothetical protein